MAYTGRIDRTAVMLGKGGEIIVDDRLVTVAPYDSRFQIVGNDGRRDALKILHGVLTSPYQVFLAL